MTKPKPPPFRPIRSTLRMADLKQRVPHSGRLMNVKLPAQLFIQIQQLAAMPGASKTAVVIALLNEGLARVDHGRAKQRDGCR